MNGTNNSNIDEDNHLNCSKFICKKGYRATRLEDIAKEIGVTKPALYYYVKNKHQILLLIFDEIMEIYMSSAIEIVKKDLDPNIKLRLLIESHARDILDNQAFTTIYFHELSELSEKEALDLKIKVQNYESIFESVYQDGVNRGLFRDLDSQIVIKAIFGTVNGLYTLSESKMWVLLRKRLLIFI